MPSDLKAVSGTQSNTKRRKKKVKSSRNKSPEDGSLDDLELDRELYPIGYYLSDRAEMVEQMFGVLSKDKILSMLPPVLKEIQWRDLKAHCLEQLNSMSEKQIIKILEGKPYAPELENEEFDRNLNVDISSSSSSSSSSTTSSSSGESSPERTSEKKVDGKTGNQRMKTVSVKNIIKPDPDKGDDDPDMLQIGVSATEMGDLLGEEETTQKKERKKVDALKGKVQEAQTASTTEKNEKKADPKGGKTLLEILELEMRARAIRALLKKAGPDKPVTPKQEVIDSSKLTKKDEKKVPTELKASPANSSKETPVVIKKEKLSDEEDVVFVSELQSKPAPPKDSKKQPQKESISAVYNEAADILQFRPTVLSSTSKVSVVDTAGNPITLPKVKSQVKAKTGNSDVIVIDGDTANPHHVSASKSESNLERPILTEGTEECSVENNIVAAKAILQPNNFTVSESSKNQGLK